MSAPVASAPMLASPMRDDQSLVRASLLGDRISFESIVDAYGPSMLRFALRLTGDLGHAEDVVQEAFVAAWLSLESFDFRSSLRTWLFSITAHKARDLGRKARAQPIDDKLLQVRAPQTEGDVSDTATLADLMGALSDALAELPYNQRACWVLREIEHMTYPEIGQILTMSSGAARGHLVRARKNLSERMIRWR